MSKSDEPKHVQRLIAKQLRRLERKRAAEIAKRTAEIKAELEALKKVQDKCVGCGHFWAGPGKVCPDCLSA